MIACIVIPGFELRVALQRRPRLRLEPAALPPEPRAEALLGPGTAAAEAAGGGPGMRLGGALGACPSLHVVGPEPAAAREAWEGIVRGLEDLGITRLGELAGLSGGAVAERLGPDGRRAWSLARGGSSRRVRGRKPPAELFETLEFPEAVGNELTLRRSLGVLLDRLLARPERGGRALRKLALSARPLRGGSWRGNRAPPGAPPPPPRPRAPVRARPPRPPPAG